MPADCNVPMHECTANCLPDSAFITAVKGDTATQPLAKSPRTLVTDIREMRGRK